ncbi:MAG: hypothetical protein ACYS8L_01565 [Planctomycetota bacterium]|jgi:hypothetical protein
MKKLVIVAIFVLLALLLYKAYTSETVQEKKRAEVSGVVQGVVKSGKEVGRGTSKAFDAVDFGGRK